MSNWIDRLAASLAWRQPRRLAAMQAQLDDLSGAVRRLETAHEGLLVRIMNLPMPRRPRKAPKSSSPLTDTLEEKITLSVVPKQLDEENSKWSAPGRL
jgi:hypothetical protein